MPPFDVVVVGAGQAGLAVGYYLRRTGRSHVLLDASPRPGGAWSTAWPSLRLFSPAEASSLPGRLLKSQEPGYPDRDAVLDYLADYEQRYALPVRRPVRVHAVRRDGDGFAIEVGGGEPLAARAVISATGATSAPHVPELPGRDAFAGRQLHSADYRGPEPFTGKRVGVVGAGNSAAQILAEVSLHGDARWFVRAPPRFMPDDVDGRTLFVEASRRYREGGAVQDLGDIVMVPPVKAARERGSLHTRPMFDRLVREGAVWDDGAFEALDAVIWCTGFDLGLDHLAPLDLVEGDGRVAVDGTRARREPMLWLVGYGSWTGFASATLIGVGRTARRTVEEVDAALT